MKRKLFKSIFAAALAAVFAIGAAACSDGEQEPEVPEVPSDSGDTGAPEAPVISEFTISAAEGEAYAKVGATHVVSYRITGDCTRETLTVRKDGAATDAYTYTTSDKHLIFETEGNYVVILTAYNGELYNTASKSLSVTPVGGNGDEKEDDEKEGETADPKPQFGKDPFGGTATDLVTNIGILLYFDAQDDKTNITYDNVSYSVTGGTLQSKAQIAYIGSGKDHPYLYSPSAGTAEVTITVTDEDNNTASAKQTFTVHAPAKGSTYESYQAYGNAVYEGIGINLDNGTDDDIVAGRQALVVTKSGVICNRTNAASLDGVTGLIYTGELGDNFTVEFDVTVLVNNPAAKGVNSLLFTLWTGEKVGSDGKAGGNLWVNWIAGAAIFGDTDLGTKGTSSSMGTVTAGTQFSLRFSRSVADSTATVKIEGKMHGASEYKTLTSYTAATSTEKANPGAKIINIVVRHLDGGAYAIENITRTKL